MADFVPKKSRLAIGGQGGPKWLANVEQMVVLNGIHAGELPWAQNLSEKCTQMVSKRFQNGSFWAKMPILTKMPLLAIGDPKWRTQVEQMMVLNGIHAGEHKQKISNWKLLGNPVYQHTMLISHFDYFSF